MSLHEGMSGEQMIASKGLWTQPFRHNIDATEAGPQWPANMMFRKMLR
jgi:hypothetical protein